jgi:long-chain acyl-CoA synthetase
MNQQNKPWLKSYPQAVDYRTPLTPKPLYELLLHAHDLYPQNIALDFKGRLYSYDELTHKAKGFARGLQNIGVRKGTHIGLYMPNCPQFLIAYFGILMAGGVVVNYNPLYSSAELRHQIEDSRTEIMVTLNLALLYDKIKHLVGDTCLKTLIIGNLSSVLPKHKAAIYSVLKYKELSHIPHEEGFYSFNEIMNNPEIDALPDVNPQTDIAVLQYTGGTTGTPKGVMLTHANLTANVEMCDRWFFSARAGLETIMGVLPFFHVFAMTAIMNYGISKGFKIILHPRFEARAVLHDVARKRPSIMAGVPTMFAALLNHPKLSQYDLSSLKMCISGGAGLPIEIKQRFEERTGCVLVEGYGLSETSPVASCNPFAGENKAGSIGLPMPKTDIVIVNQDDGETIMGIGEIGEIAISGAGVMLGYFNKPVETEAVLRDGLLKTGDLGYIDEDGYVFVVDRKKEMILSCGYNIYPRQIEEAIYRHKAVLECAVIGVKHAVKGEVPKAFIVLREGENVSAIDMRQYLKGEIAAYAVPSEYEFVESLPKSIIGKILKKELK